MDKTAGDSNRLLIWALAPFFGWLLSFPFYGPVFPLIAPIHPAEETPLILIFISTHALTFLAGGAFLKKTFCYRRIMIRSLVACILLSIFLWFANPEVWPAGMALMGISAALFILAWSHAYAAGPPGSARMKRMALLIIVANVFFLIIRTLSSILALNYLLPVLLAPLFLSFWLLLKSRPSEKIDENAPSDQKQGTSIALLTLALFIFGLYLTSGLMYNVIYASHATHSTFFLYFQYTPYKLVLLLMWLYGAKQQHYFTIYMGVSLLGLAFVSFALLTHDPVSYIITETILQAAFALLDLFCWVLLGEVASVHGFPSRVFGYSLGAMSAAILTGDLVGGQLLIIGENYRLLTAIFAACAIFLVLLVMPWMYKHVLKEHGPLPAHPVPGEPLARLIPQPQAEKIYTPREIEIIKHLLTGSSNKTIAEELFISENTLKTHLRNIYKKAGVTRKRELLSKAIHEPGISKTEDK